MGLENEWAFLDLDDVAKIEMVKNSYWNWRPIRDILGISFSRLVKIFRYFYLLNQLLSFLETETLLLLYM